MFKTITILEHYYLHLEIEILGNPDKFGRVACGVLDGKIIIESCLRSKRLSEL